MNIGLGIGIAFPSSGAGSTPLVTSYANTGGTGDRRAIITVTSSSGLLYAPGLAPNSNLVNGTTGNNITASTGFLGATAAAAWIQFEWGAGSSKIINEITWKQSGAEAHGVWKVQGSADASSWTDIGSTFTLGGTATQVITTVSANTTGYRYYRLLGVSGTTSGNPYLYEVEFKIN